VTTRYSLRLHLAHGIAVALNGCAIKYEAAVRHCTRSYLTAFGIRKDTLLNGSDWLAALQLVSQERASRLQDKIPPAQAPSFARMNNVAQRKR